MEENIKEKEKVEVKQKESEFPYEIDFSENEEMLKLLKEKEDEQNGINLLIKDLTIQRAKLHNDLWAGIYKMYPELSSKLDISINTENKTLVVMG